ncbi:MAG: hypothetical protein ACO1RX_20740 [Candidatus Sericytochromatia bacterium]
MKHPLLLLLLLSACQAAPLTSQTTLQPQTDLAFEVGTPSSASAEAVPAATLPAETAPGVSPAKPVTGAQAAKPQQVAKPQQPVSPVAAPAQPQLAAQGPAQSVAVTSLKVPQNFDFATTRVIEVDVTALNPNGQPYAKVMVAVYSLDGQALSPLIRGVTDASGRFYDLLRLPAYHKQLNVQVSALGIANGRTLTIQNNRISARFGE